MDAPAAIGTGVARQLAAAGLAAAWLCATAYLFWNVLIPGVSFDPVGNPADERVAVFDPETMNQVDNFSLRALYAHADRVMVAITWGLPSAAATEIASNVASIFDSAQGTVDGAESTARSSAELDALAQEPDAAVGRFKT